MNSLLSVLTIGMIMSLLAMGVYISFRLFSFPDITAEGSLTLGAAVGATVLIQGHSPLMAITFAFVAGMAAGTVTGLIHTGMKINGLLAGIIVMTGLYSINLQIMGRSNLQLYNVPTYCSVGKSLLKSQPNTSFEIAGWAVQSEELLCLPLTLLLVGAIMSLIYLFFRTALGTAMRASGNNPRMAASLGINPDMMLVFGLALSNGLIACCGALLAQNQGYADVQMGVGMLVWGMACVIIGETIVKTSRLDMIIVGAVFGSIIFRLIVSLSMECGLMPNDLKLLTAIFVLAALMLPRLMGRLSCRNHTREKSHADA